LKNKTKKAKKVKVEKIVTSENISKPSKQVSNDEIAP